MLSWEDITTYHNVVLLGAKGVGCTSLGLAIVEEYASKNKESIFTNYLIGTLYILTVG